jgi:hypothetical protein
MYNHPYTSLQSYWKDLSSEFKHGGQEQMAAGLDMTDDVSEWIWRMSVAGMYCSWQYKFQN